MEINQVKEREKQQQKTALFTAIVGNLPLSIGRKSRQFFYKFILGKIGKNVNFHVGIDLASSKGIFVEDNVQIFPHVNLNCWTPGSQIILHDAAVIDRGTYLQAMGGCIEVGQKTYLGPYFCAAGPGDISIGKNCLIGSHSSVYANNHKFDDPTVAINQQGLICKGIKIEDDCWLGTGVRVLDGVTIGKGSVIGAGAVVNRSIPPYSIAVGVPAKVISKRNKDEKKSVPASKSTVH